MGCTVSNPDNPTSEDTEAGQLATSQTRKIDAEIRSTKKARTKEIKLLMLGAGESGKSTVLKQMKVLHREGFTVAERQRLLPAVYNHVLASISAIVAALDHLNIALHDDSLRADVDVIKGMGSTAHWSHQVWLSTCKLWADAGVQQCFSRSNEFQLNDNADYFFNKLAEIGCEDYLPSAEDIFRARIQTTGIFECKFDVGSSVFNMVDVGGQRSERRKWIMCFQDVKAILFVVAISAFDQTCREDMRKNRLEEDLDSLRATWNHRLLLHVSFILLQNKIDILAKKIQSPCFNLARYFPEYTGDASYTSVTSFIQDKFMAVDETPLAARTACKRRLYPHHLCAVDTDLVKLVFRDVQNIVLNGSLYELGFT